jgi:hypothetical protein
MIDMKRNSLKMKLVVLLVLVNILACKGQEYTKWENNQTINHIQFERIRYKMDKQDTVLIIGQLKNEIQIGGYLCAPGLVHFNKNFEIQLFKLAAPLKIGKHEIGAETWVSLEKRGFIACIFQQATKIEDYVCMPGKETAGPQVVFDQTGNLRSFFSPHDVKIGNVYCSGGKTNEIGLLKNGALEFCTFSIDQIINDVKYTAKTIVYFDFNGNVSSTVTK